MANRRNTPLSRSAEDLADARELRAAISAAVAEVPMNEDAVRCAVWSFVGNERRACLPPALVIMRLTGLIERANISPCSARLELTSRVILWCVEEYFGHLGGDALGLDRFTRSADFGRQAVNQSPPTGAADCSAALPAKR